MAFPAWTLWGMGMSLAAALLVTGLSLYWQSSRYKRRSYIEPYRLEARLRAFTTYTLATLLLFVGFFLAGVPLNNPVGEGAVAELSQTEPVVTSEGDSAEFSSPPPNTPVTGAFSGPPPTRTPMPISVATTAPETSGSVTEISAETVTPPAPVTPSPLPIPSSTPTATPQPTATITPTPTATPSPTPTFTPTPIVEPTAKVNTGGGTLRVRRTPGGDNITLINHNDIIILAPGHANQAGVQWQEIMTVDGIIGWVQRDFLDFGGG